MAKSAKQKAEEIEQPTINEIGGESKVEETPISTTETQPETTEQVATEQSPTEPVVTVTVSEVPVWGNPPSDEIEFLKKILQIQEEGCFGRHLNGMINDRIKSLQK